MPIRLFHISEEPNIETFEPRPSPQHYEQIESDVVFAISGEMLHNYLLPRNCPRVAFYAGADTTKNDIAAFIPPGAKYVIALETSWREAIRDTQLYCYEMPPQKFQLLDENAGYYISYEAVTPMSVVPVRDPLQKIADKGVAVMFVSSLWPLAEEVQQSTLCYSLIRMSQGRGRSERNERI